MESTGNAMIEAIGSGLTSVISWFGDVVTALTSSSGALAPLLPLFAIGIGVSLVLIVVKFVRRISWGA